MAVSNLTPKVEYTANGSNSKFAFTFVVPANTDPGSNINTISSVSGTASTNILATTTETFTTEDVGKVIVIVGAGSGGADLNTTVLSFTNSNAVVLSTNILTTVSGTTANITTGLFGTTMKDTGDMKVFVNGTEQTDPTHYTITLNSGDESNKAGNVNFVSPPASSSAVVIKRDIELARTTDFQTAGAFKATTVNQEFDTIIMAVQDAQLDTDQSAIKFPLDETPGTTFVPNSTNRSNKLFAFNSTGEIVMRDDVTQGGAAINGTTITATTGFVGNLTGDVTGDITGDITGNISSTGTSTFATADINGGTIDGTTIGASSAAPVTATNLTASGTISLNSLTYPTTDGTNEQVLSTDGAGNLTFRSIAGLSLFTALTDTPSAYTGEAGKYVRVNSGETGLEFDALTTDDVTEGSNLYYTNARADARIANNIIDEDNFSSDSSTRAPSQQSTKAYIQSQIETKDNSDEITEGSTNLYFTDARARAAVSVTDAGGDGSLAYNSSTGVITYTGPSASEVRAHFTAGEGIDISSGAISGEDATDSNKGIASFSSSNFDVSSGAVSLKANGINDTHLDFGTGTNQINTDDLTEGSTNQYYTDARARASISTTTASASSGGALAYDNSTGVLTFTPTDISDFVTMSTTQNITGDKTFTGSNYFTGFVEFDSDVRIDHKLRIKDNEFLTFGDDDDVKMRYNSGSNRFDIDITDASQNDKGFLRMRADNTIDIQAGKDQTSKGDLLLTSYDDFQFRKGFMTKSLGNVTATGAAGQEYVTLGSSLTTAQSVALSGAENLVFKHSTGTGDEFIHVIGVSGSGASTVIELEENLAGTMSGATAELFSSLRATKFVIETSDRDTPSRGKTTLQNRLGQEGPQDNQLIFESVVFNDGGEPFSASPGSSTDQIDRPVKYTLETKADKNSFTLTHQRTTADTDTDTEIFKVTNKTTETSTEASPTSPDSLKMGVDIDVNDNKLVTTVANGNIITKPDHTAATGNFGPQGNYGWSGGKTHINGPLSITNDDTPDIAELFNAGIQVKATHESYPALVLKAQASNDRFGNVWFLRSGSDGTDARVSDGATLGGFFASGYQAAGSSANYNTVSASCFFVAAGAHSDSNSGGFFQVKATNEDSTSQRTVANFKGNRLHINPDNENIDFRVDGDTSDNILFVDASNENVGIKNASPSATLDVTGSFKATTLDASMTLDKLGDVAYPSAPTDGQFLKYIDANSRWEPADIGIVATLAGNLTTSEYVVGNFNWGFSSSSGSTGTEPPAGTTYTLGRQHTLQLQAGNHSKAESAIGSGNSNAQWTGGVKIANSSFVEFGLTNTEHWTQFGSHSVDWGSNFRNSERNKASITFGLPFDQVLHGDRSGQINHLRRAVPTLKFKNRGVINHAAKNLTLADGSGNNVTEQVRAESSLTANDFNYGGAITTEHAVSLEDGYSGFEEYDGIAGVSKSGTGGLNIPNANDLLVGAYPVGDEFIDQDMDTAIVGDTVIMVGGKSNTVSVASPSAGSSREPELWAMTRDQNRNRYLIEEAVRFESPSTGSLKYQTFTLNSAKSLPKNSYLVQANTNATARVKTSTTNSTSVVVYNVTGTWNTSDSVTWRDGGNGVLNVGDFTPTDLGTETGSGITNGGGRATFGVPITFANKTTTERDALTAATGMVLFNTTTTKLQVYTGSSWVDLH